MSVDIVGQIVAYTERAILLRSASGEAWIPKSQVVDCPDDDVLEESRRDEQEVELQVKEWFTDRLEWKRADQLDRPKDQTVTYLVHVRIPREPGQFLDLRREVITTTGQADRECHQEAWNLLLSAGVKIDWSVK